MRLAIPFLALSVAVLPLHAGAAELRFELGAGAAASPAYEGSDEYKVGPTGTAGLERLDWWFFDIDRGDGLGFGIGPSFRIVGERDDDDHARLTGIDDVDTALEVGLKVSYRWPGAEVFGALRGGVTGHEGLVMDLGADAIWQTDPKTVLTLGPRLRFADEVYADTYFDVPAGATLAAYDADAGVHSYGLEMSVRHDFNETWAVEGTLGYDRLAGSMGDSPIVQTRDQGRVSVVLIRSFDWAW